MGDELMASGWTLTTQGYEKGPWRLYQADTWCVAVRTDVERMVARNFESPEAAAAWLAGAASVATVVREDEGANAPTLFTASDLARFCHCDMKTIHNWVDLGKIDSFRTPGRHLRFTAEAVKVFLERWRFPVPAVVAHAVGNAARAAAGARVGGGV